MTDYPLGTTIYLNFTTRAFSTGIPTQLAGSPVLSVLEENNATPITAGVSVSVDRATVTGLNQATIVATSGNGYESGKSYCVYISTGTVGGVSVVGEVVGQFTIEKASALRPATSGRTVVVDASGLVDANTVKIGPTGSGAAQTAKDVGGAVPAAAAGASGGLLISGSNAGTTTLGALTITGTTTFTGTTVHTGNVSMANGLTITQATGNGAGVSITGNGTGAGVSVTSGSGATGNAITATAASTNGSGLALVKTGSGSDLLATVTPLTLAKTTNITGFNDIAATAVVSAGAITTSGGAVSSVTTVTGNVDGNVGGNVTGSVGSVTGLTASNLDATISSRATPSEVNAEVLDVLNVDTFAEPAQGAPAATTTLAAKINYLYKFLRNKITQTATTLSVYDDAGTTVDHKTTVSDDGSTYTRGEIISGP